MKNWIVNIYRLKVRTSLLTILTLVGALAADSSSLVLYNFTGGANGEYPFSGVITDPAGNIYGTASGSTSGQGVVFKIDTTGTQTVLHHFTGPDGAYPIGGLVRDTAGNLYGTTSGGGITTGLCHPRGCGVIFKLETSGNFTVLHKFNSEDGQGVTGDMILDSAGNLYGISPYGGLTAGKCRTTPLPGCGVVFKVSPQGHVTVLYAFTGGADGYAPYKGLARDPAGNLYGVTEYGGVFDNGVLFKLDVNGSYAVLYSFDRSADGEYPDGMVRDQEGNLYGTTQFGGITAGVCAKNAEPGCGVVYRLDPTGKFTVLHRFTGRDDGSTPLGGVVIDAEGNLYGTAAAGGNATGPCAGFGCGTVFKVDQSGNFTLLHRFNGADGSGAYSTVYLDSAGDLLGSTVEGGQYNLGVVFEVKGCDNCTAGVN
jgi:uncharacterized repeat protein (TIGR03803 family)